MVKITYPQSSLILQIPPIKTINFHVQKYHISQQQQQINKIKKQTFTFKKYHISQTTID